MTLRLGIIECDTTHVYQFARRLNHVGIEPNQWAEGARVVAAYPGTSRIVEPARLDGYVAALQAAEVELVKRPTDLLGRVDGVLVESNAGCTASSPSPSWPLDCQFSSTSLSP